MKITYINHSGFLIETKDCYYIFDYYKGAYSVYHLEDSYIDMSNETIIIRIAKTLFVMSVIFVSNYVFYVIGTSKDTGRIRLKRKL